MAKFGLVLLVIAACGLAFLAGVAAPPSVGETLQQAAARLGALAPGPAASATATASTSAAAAAPASAASSAPAGVAAAATPPASAASVPLGALQLPSLPPAATPTYALQVGQFAARESAQQLLESVRGRGVPATLLTTVDGQGTWWAVVAIGRFASVAEAQAQRIPLANQLGLGQNLPVVLLPPAAQSP